MNKKSKERSPWVNTTPWILVMFLVLWVIYWLGGTRETISLSLRYDELRQLLLAAKQNPSLRLEHVRVGREEIRGEVITRDLVSGLEKPKESEPESAEFDPLTVTRQMLVTFRAQRKGLEEDQELYALLKEAAPGFDGEQEESPLKGIYSLIFSFLLLAGAVVAAFLVLRWITGGQSPLSFGRSKHKAYVQKDTRVTFQDVAGIEEAKAELLEVVDFLKNPTKYQALGGHTPKGVLLVGPPGTGKTLLAKAVAGEADVAFFSLSGSDFVEMFVGVGAARVRDLFMQAEAQAPCIIFIDELDALGKTRSGSAIGTHDERDQTLNQLLVEMDGFDTNRGIIVMAATNRPDTLDSALLRPGRFDRTVVVDRPDVSGREAILKVHIRNVKVGEEVDLRRVAALTPGMVGADLANLVNEAAILAARNDKQVVSMVEFEEAIERLEMGLQRKSRIMSPEEKKRTAIHEAGHALVACSLANATPVQKVTIIPRGVGALGYVWYRDEVDRYMRTKSELESYIKVALGGTLAEELIFREVATGATSDLEKVSELARSMVKKFGMSKLGRVSYQASNRNDFLGGAFGDMDREYSEHTARQIDVEVKRIIDAATEDVRELLLSRRQALEAIAQELMEKEVMDGADLRLLIEQQSPGPKLVPGSVALPEPSEESARISTEPGNDPNVTTVKVTPT